MGNCIQSSPTTDHIVLSDRKDDIPISIQEVTQPRQEPHVFEVIIDDKHRKYMSAYDAPKVNEVFWGIGIENECYLQLGTLSDATSFRQLSRRRERYSVDYYRNFREDDVQKVFHRLHELPTVRYPIYVNGHTFQSTDTALEHKTLYDEFGTPNPKFTVSIHERLLSECAYYKDVFQKSLVFDGDSIEFITQDFYKTTVQQCVEEWQQHKRRFVSEVGPFFRRWRIQGANEGFDFPRHNYGLVSFLSTYRRNVTPCNNGTIHLNLTLPTQIRGEGDIVDMPAFVRDHLKVIDAIQIVEPLLVACYGTPDVFSVVMPNRGYAVGSLRVALSRYISLQTFSTEQPVNGKLLLMKRPQDPEFWYNQLHDGNGRGSPYVKNEEIGYDINFNKFKNHGVELRFLDAFPEVYAEGLLQFLILLAAHAVASRPLRSIHCRKSLYSKIIIGCVQRGFMHILSVDECNQILLEDLCFTKKDHVETAMTAYQLLCHINRVLYRKQGDSEIVCQMIGHALKEPPHLVNYNWEAYRALYEDIYGKPILLLRAEENPLESRTPLVPRDIGPLIEEGAFTVYVERSPQRCFPDRAYEDVGARLVERGAWRGKPWITIGLKGLPQDATEEDVQGTHAFFAHCFKQQRGYQHILSQLRQATFVDYETMVDSKGKRVLSFCTSAGLIGCYLALMSYYKTFTDVVGFPQYDESLYLRMLCELRSLRRLPRVLITGNGTVAHGCMSVLKCLEIPFTVWNHESVKDKRVILAHDILIHTISLRNGAAREVFLEESDLEEDDVTRTLSVICDISCDLGNPRNALPVYSEYTTLDHPVRRIRSHPPLDLIAVPCIPAMDPVRASEAFSGAFKDYACELPFFRQMRDISPYSRAMEESFHVFQGHLGRV